MKTKGYEFIKKAEFIANESYDLQSKIERKDLTPAEAAQMLTHLNDAAGNLGILSSRLWEVVTEQMTRPETVSNRV